MPPSRPILLQAGAGGIGTLLGGSRGRGAGGGAPDDIIHRPLAV